MNKIIKYILLGFAALLAFSFTSVRGEKLEWNFDRPGSDITSFNAWKADPKVCSNACAKNPKCKAWTYVKPNTIQGPKPRCWLKHAVPKPVKNNCCVSGVKGAVVKPVPVKPMEFSIDRPGSDFSNFRPWKADPKVCSNACAKNPKCKAWTYVKPNTIQGPKPNCWLKHSVPKPVKNSCCISGVKSAAVKPVPVKPMEFSIDRPGMDFRNFNLASANPTLCRNECAKDAKCKAWTYVKPNTIQGPKPRCWLKHAVPKAVKNSCCVSGVK